MSQTRRLAAILAADVAGYSRLMGADEEGTHARLKAHLAELANPKIAEHRGRIVKNTGDGLLAEFASVVDAVRCAVEVQRGMADREPEAPEERRIRFRIGINLGDVIADGVDIFGDGVNVAARLETLAEPGGICISGVVREQIRDKLPYPFEDNGEQSVKNIARPVRIFALCPETIAELPMAGAPIVAPPRRPRIVAPIATIATAVLLIAVIGWWSWPATRSPSTPPTAVVAAATSIPPTRPAPRLSIVVLPFANLSSDPDQQYFADGVTENLTTDLSRLAHMLVISRNTAFTYRNKPVGTKQIGRELGVRYVLEGSVQRSGDRLRVTAQLIDAEADAHLWVERFDRDIGDLFTLQDEVTSRLANSLGFELIGKEAAQPTDHPEALDYIFRGRAVLSRPASRDRYAEAISLFEHALALDPQSAEAQARLASTLMARVLDGMSASAAADIARAEGLVDHALTESPRSPLAHHAKGNMLRAQTQALGVRSGCDEAIPEYETALASNRNDVGALAGIALCKFYTGSIEEAVALVEQAMRLSPRDPFIYVWYLQIGRGHLLQSRTDEAILWFEKARRTNPAHPLTRAFLASAYGLKGETELAIAELAETQRLASDDRYSSLARLKSAGYWGVPKIRALHEATFFAGLRKAGMPEE